MESAAGCRRRSMPDGASLPIDAVLAGPEQATSVRAIPATTTSPDRTIRNDSGSSGAQLCERCRGAQHFGVVGSEPEGPQRFWPQARGIPLER